MTGGGVKAGKAFVEFIISDKKLDGQLNKIGSKLRSVGSIGSAAMAPIIAAFVGAASHFANFGGELDDISKRTTVSASKLAEWGDAAEAVGADVNVLEKGLLSLRKKGIDPNNFAQVAADIAAIEDPTERGQAAMELFGRTAGAKLLPMIEQLPQLTQRFRELGGTISDEDVAAADDLGDSFREVKKQLSILSFQIGAAIAGPLTDFFKAAQPILKWVIDFTKEHKGLVSAIAAITFALGGASIAAATLGFAITALKAHPIIAAASAAAAIAIYLNSGTEQAEKLKEMILTIFPLGRAVLKVKSLVTGETTDTTKKPTGGSFADDLYARGAEAQQKLRASFGGAATSMQPSASKMAGELARESRNLAMNNALGKDGSGRESAEILERIEKLIRHFPAPSWGSF